MSRAGSCPLASVFDAVRVRRIEIGEAIKGLPVHLLDHEPATAWNDIARMRDRLPHCYFHTDHSYVAHAVAHDLQPLEDAVLRLLVHLSRPDVAPDLTGGRRRATRP